MKKELSGDYCSQHLSFYKTGTFEEAIQKLQKLADKYTTSDFDEVVVTVSLGRRCTSPTRCQPCIFYKRRAKKPQTSDNNSQ